MCSNRTALVLAFVGILSAQKAPDPITVPGASHLTSDERQFIIDAALEGNKQVDMSQMAMMKATNKKVKEFATMMVRDYSRANTQLKQVAVKNGIDLLYPSDNPNAEGGGARYAELSKLSGEEYDQRYAAQQVSDFKNSIALYEHGNMIAMDADVKQLIQKVLPVLRSRLPKVEGLERDVLKK